MPIKKLQEDTTDDCYLEYVDGHLTCTFNHKAGDKCLMDKDEEEINKAYELGRKEEREECIRYMRSGNISGSFSTGCDCEDCNKYEKKVRKDLSDHSEGKK